MTTHQIGDRFTHGKYDIILGSDGYALQEVATGRNPLWWDAQNFIGGFDTLEQAITAVELIEQVLPRLIPQPMDYDQWKGQTRALFNHLTSFLFDLKGI